ncbi:N-acetyltransferase [Campylobacter sp. RM9344]|uniref:N-acetyltransferase n=1 Tax=Campylobacter californiensis TaxID=1032243 RepID=A0AAW3ZQW2_9BACT|nr:MULTISPECIES: GNAT family N-acetyltransferase [unclassified Campylobacter]MBE2984561.1 N-acetyltransferase [Campylobacter sp. RM6883]MBE2987028.1 N-acetyltransferase [Campylobacter sp. RM12919]MBE2988685.1 N-acetyltransferase [Campylobacter sp. RM12920]MBE2995151.1 N-acetyltransferase [Campylobacter sp. RM6913]MBE3021690.1 N-acetyltransferase [Campylobacter sp. 7477a]MBE3029072.1 N-acetyltransferase [Campylobacter sp. RM9344]
MEILHATQDDLAKITEIYNQNIATKNATADLTPVSIASRQEWFDAHSKTRPIFVLKLENSVVAWGSFSDFYKRSAYDITAEISIYVDKNARQSGIGSKLLAFMLDIAPSLGIKTILALIFAHNKPSISLFNKFGFEKFGLLPQVCDMQEFIADVLIMGKRV